MWNVGAFHLNTSCLVLYIHHIYSILKQPTKPKKKILIKISLYKNLINQQHVPHTVATGRYVLYINTDCGLILRKPVLHKQ